ncbi:hypothetical protein SDC9_141214 [bioreactor metagenome]|uniref:Uncharacterized protein n=1 Tax=bioreactor metagenome TaxID=1076179 RepID=A0A645DXM3_9ZZZZ
MARQHFSVGVDIDSLVFGLLQEQVEIVEIMAGNNDERSLFNGERDSDGNRNAVGLSVGAVEQVHTSEVDFAGFKYQRQELFHGFAITHGAQAFIEEIIYDVIRITQDQSVIGISGHTAQAQKNQGFKRTNIFLIFPEDFHSEVFSTLTGQ